MDPLPVGVKSPKKELAKVSIGWIDYLNLLPLRVEISKNLGKRVEWKEGHPTQVNKWLRDGTVHLGPASSINLLSLPKLETFIPFGVASRGAVQSVYIGMHREHEEFYKFVVARQNNLASLFQSFFKEAQPRRVCKQIFDETASVKGASEIKLPRLEFSGASATSACLSKILFRLWLGESVSKQLLSQRTQISTERPVELVIGDEALERRSQFHYKLDLGELWHQLTELPFVFAVWQINSKIDRAALKQIAEAAKLADAKMRIDPSEYFPTQTPLDDQGAAIDLSDYWKHIHYKLDAEHVRSLLMFFCFSKQTMPLEQHERTIEKIMYYESLHASGQLI